MAEWLVDSLVGFLRSPAWKHPVENFIEQKCIVFDPEDENKFSYTEVHAEYKRLVERALEGFMAELGLTAEQLAEAYTHNSSSGNGGDSGKGKENEKLFEQLLAAEDFLVFKSMMVGRNIDLELQALTALQRQLGHSPGAYTDGASGNPDSGGVGSRKSEDDDEILDEILKQSKAEYDLQQSHDEQQLDELLKVAKEESLKLYQGSQIVQESLADSLTRAVLDPAGSDTCSTTEQKKETMHMLPVLPPVKKQSPPPSSFPQPDVQTTGPSKPTLAGGISGSEAAAVWLKNAKSELQAEHSTHAQKVASEEDLKARAAYLRRQRDRLLATKKEKRPSSSLQPSPPAAAAAVVAVARVKPPHSLEAVATTTEHPERQQEEQSLSSRRAGSGGGGSGSNTGVLCSAIAGKLRRELGQP